MAAGLWSLFVGVDLVFAALVAAALERHGSVPPSATLALAAAVMLLAPALLTLSSFVGAAASLAAAGELELLPLLRALLTEWLDFDRAVLAMMASPWIGRRAAAAAGTGRGAHPVLLIHGVLCNGGIWRPWLGLLRAAGFGPVRTVDLEPLLGDLDTHAQTVAKALEELQHECAGSRVSIVAHSMGGLVARAALRRAGPAIIRDIVTIASPHEGTELARWLPSLPARQMRPRSPWLRALAAEEAAPAAKAAGAPAVPITSIFSAQDNLIVPARSAALRGARLIRFVGVGHLGMLLRRRCIDAAIAALGAPAGG